MDVVQTLTPEEMADAQSLIGQFEDNLVISFAGGDEWKFLDKLRIFNDLVFYIEKGFHIPDGNTEYGIGKCYFYNFQISRDAPRHEQAIQFLERYLSDKKYDGFSSDYYETKLFHDAIQTYAAASPDKARNYLSTLKNKQEVAASLETKLANMSLMSDDRDSKIYRTMKIGFTTWMSENLAYCGADSKTYDNCGFQYYRSDSAVVCPTGWRLPSDNDFANLNSFIKEQIMQNPTFNVFDEIGFSAQTSGCFFSASDNSPTYPEVVYLCNKKLERIAGVWNFIPNGLGRRFSMFTPVRLVAITG